MTTVGTKVFYANDVNLSKMDKAEVAKLATGQAYEIGDEDQEAVTFTQLYGVQNIPELQTAPSGIDTTSIEDEEEQSEPGLISGSTLNVTMNYKEEVNNLGGDNSNFAECLMLSNDAIHLFKIALRNGRWFLFRAKARTVMGAMAVASASQFTLSLYKRSKVFTGWKKPESAGKSSSDDMVDTGNEQGEQEQEGEVQPQNLPVQTTV